MEEATVEATASALAAATNLTVVETADTPNKPAPLSSSFLVEKEGRAEQNIENATPATMATVDEAVTVAGSAAPMWQTHHEIPLDWESKLEEAVLSPRLPNAAKVTGLLPENCPEYGNCPRGPKCGYWHIGLTPDNKATAPRRSPAIKTPVRPRGKLTAVNSAAASSSNALERSANLDQSALQQLDSDDDDNLSDVAEEASDESELEEGEVDKPMPKISTPADLVKFLKKEKRKARELARKRLDLSPHPSPTKDSDKVCILNNPKPDLVPALGPDLVPFRPPNPDLEPALGPDLVPAVPALVQEVQAVSVREAAATEMVERPRRSCAISKYFRDNYVLDMKTVPTPAVAKEQSKSKPRRSRSLSAASNRSGIGSEPTKPPSILQFLKPMGSSKKGSKGGQNETLLKPKVTAAEPCSEATVSQTLMQDHFSKN